MADHRLSELELHVSHACNLACESCSHFSNQNHRGLVGLDEAERWIEPWSRRVEVGTFKLLGGEPTLNPDLAKFPPMVRRRWPRADIWIITNGFFLDRHPDLPFALADTGGKIFLSIHHASAEYRARIQPNIDLLMAWRERFGIAVEVWDAVDRWTRRYHGSGTEMRPFEDADPRASWDHCAAKRCKQLFEGDLWKCPPVAYLRLQQRKHRLDAAWDPYLRYQPLRPDCTDAALADFLQVEDEAVCAMCPAAPEQFEPPMPIPRRAAKAAAVTAETAPS